jgi:transposase
LDEYIRISQKSPELLQIWFWDESGFCLKPGRGKTWTKKGHRKKISGKRRQGRINVMGGLRFSDKKHYVDFIKKGNSESFFSVLQGFYNHLKYEWAGIDKNPEDFDKSDHKIILILDNASIHKTKEFLEKIQKDMPNLVLEFLPEYSPDYNLIELVWHSAKEFISNRLFNSIEDIESLLNKLFNEGDLIINWGRKIKNKGNLINAI